MAILVTYHKNFISIILPIILPHLIPLASGQVEALHRRKCCLIAKAMATASTNDVDRVPKSNSCSSIPCLILENDDIKSMKGNYQLATTMGLASLHWSVATS